ncbi:hypothetical protein [Neptuniibacter sp. QD37_11]|uniref:hypothetical protein n=1 Tax=Neptuniibacter sp. QD37_11 TaxID=3398209 RepID=UPI0039F46611
MSNYSRSRYRNNPSTLFLRVSLIHLLAAMAALIGMFMNQYGAALSIALAIIVFYESLILAKSLFAIGDDHTGHISNPSLNDLCQSELGRYQAESLFFGISHRVV